MARWGTHMFTLSPFHFLSVPTSLARGPPHRRIVLGFGFFPAACTWYLRATMPETPRAQMRAMREAAVARRLAREAAASSAAAAAEGDPSAVAASSLQVADARDMNFRTFIRRHARELIGCAVTWFMLDVAFYSQARDRARGRAGWGADGAAGPDF